MVELHEHEGLSHNRGYLRHSGQEWVEQAGNEEVFIEGVLE